LVLKNDTLQQSGKLPIPFLGFAKGHDAWEKAVSKKGDESHGR